MYIVHDFHHRSPPIYKKTKKKLNKLKVLVLCFFFKLNVLVPVLVLNIIKVSVPKIEFPCSFPASKGLIQPPRHGISCG